MQKGWIKSCFTMNCAQNYHYRINWVPGHWPRSQAKHPRPQSQKQNWEWNTWTKHHSQWWCFPERCLSRIAGEWLKLWWMFISSYKHKTTKHLNLKMLKRFWGLELPDRSVVRTAPQSLPRPPQRQSRTQNLGRNTWILRHCPRWHFRGKCQLRSVDWWLKDESKTNATI